LGHFKDYGYTTPIAQSMKELWGQISDVATCIEGYVVDLYVGVCEKVLVLTSNGRNRVSERHFGQLLSHVHHPV